MSRKQAGSDRLLPGIPYGLIVLFLWLAPALASFPLQAQEDGRVTVRVDGRTVFRVSATEEAGAAERAQAIERRLNTLLETPAAIGPSQVEVEANGNRVISMAGVPVVTVTRNDADDNLLGLDALAAQWSSALDQVMLRARERRTTTSGRFTSEIRASVQAAFSRLIESAIRIIPRALAALLVITLFWAAAALIRQLMNLIFCHVVDDLTVQNLIKQTTYYFVWALGLMVSVDALGFDPQTVVTGLGLTGLALGFALKDIISNFVSGILILTLRPFRLGDQIIVGDTEGAVERIQLRATEIRTYDGRLVLVPNAEVFTSRVTNNTASPVRRGSVELYLGYEVDLRKCTEVLSTATQGAAGVLKSPSVAVLVQDLGQNAILLEGRFWTDSRRADFLDTASAVRVAVVEKLRQAGIGLPNPAVRVVVPAEAEASEGPAS